jgi:hypothetical protein
LLNPVPFIFTSRLTGPEAGERESIIGTGGVTVKAIWADPKTLLTVTVVKPCLASHEILNVAIIEVWVIFTLLTLMPGLSVLTAVSIKRKFPEMVTPTVSRALAEFGEIPLTTRA